MIPTDWMTVPEVVDYARSSRTEVHEALRTGRLRGHQVKAQGKYRIHRDDVDAWLRGVAPAPINPKFTRRTA
jgi:excisionase family DNA binding protein